MDWCDAMAIYPMNEKKENFIHDSNYESLYKQMDNGTLATYTYLVPRIKSVDPNNPPNT